MQSPTKYNHAEAFCHMTYRCEAGHTVTIWNSRDGVTPFGMGCRVEGCDAHTRHINFQDDRRDPDYQLRQGDWFWRDGTKTEAETIMLKRLTGHPPDAEQLQAFGVQTVGELARLWTEDETGEFQHGWPMLDQYPTGPDAAARSMNST